MKYKIVVFDLDGTILNTLEDLADSTNYALSVFDMPERTIEEIRHFVGNGIRKLMESMKHLQSITRSTVPIRQDLMME